MIQIKNSRILVTGGAGFIGSHIVDDLLVSGAKKVIVFDDFSSGSMVNLNHIRSDNRLGIVNGNILNLNELSNVMKNVDIVSHQAAQLEIFKAINDPVMDLNTNLMGTINVLSAAQKNGVKKVINASSACVYGQALYTPQDEDHPKCPQWPYGASKYSAEIYCRMFHEYFGLPNTSLRYGIVYGPREWYGRVLTVFLNRLISNSLPVLFGNGRQTRDFIFVKDLVTLHNRCIENMEDNCDFFNVGSGVGTTIYDLAKLILSCFEVDQEPVYEDLQEGELSKYVKNRKRIPSEQKEMELDISKAKKSMDWKPTFDLKTGIEHEIHWIRENYRQWDVSRPKV